MPRFQVTLLSGDSIEIQAETFEAEGPDVVFLGSVAEATRIPIAYLMSIVELPVAIVREDRTGPGLANVS
jgi:hypothetical protein